MPIYEFECEACEARTEKMLPVGRNIRKCPECGKSKLKRVFSAPAYHDTYSPMHPRRGRGNGGYGRIEPGQGTDFGKNLG